MIFASVSRVPSVVSHLVPLLAPFHSSPYTLRVPERSGGTNRVTEGKEVRPDTKRTEPGSLSRRKTHDGTVVTVRNGRTE